MDDTDPDADVDPRRRRSLEAALSDARSWKQVRLEDGRGDEHVHHREIDTEAPLPVLEGPRLGTLKGRQRPSRAILSLSTGTHGSLGSHG